jgi:hypothetical protein
VWSVHRIHGLDDGSGGDVPVGENVGAWAASVDQLAECAFGGEVFEV